MKKNIVLAIMAFALLNAVALAQYISPGNNSSFDLSDLVSVSAGAVTLESDGYHFHADITISSSDTLHLLDDGSLVIHEGILWTIEGVLVSNPPTQFEISSAEGEGNFQGIRFDNSSASNLQNLVFNRGGGIKLVESSLEIRNCEFYDFVQDYSTATIDLFHANPLIRDSYFENNAGAAIASGANGASSPRIINNVLLSNVSSNGNYPQINLGTSDGLQPIRIDSNQIVGQYIMSGGIAVSTLAGGNASAIITNNEVYDNRYGIAMIGSNISSVINNNILIGNNIQGDAMQGGSGINFYGGATNTSIVSDNIIMENLWGITIQLNAQPNFGDGTDTSPGRNWIEDNQNSFQVYGLYNNTPGDIYAINNYWGTTDLAVAETYIFHQNDDVSLGLVHFDPMWIDPVGISDLSDHSTFLVYPNPCSDYLEIQGYSEEVTRFEVVNLTGEFISYGQLQNGKTRIEVSKWPAGSYIVKIYTQNQVNYTKLLVQ